MPRILIATLLGLAFFFFYVVASILLADLLSPMHWALQCLYFALAGTIWVLPIRWLMFWAARRPDRTPTNSPRTRQSTPA